MVIDSIAESDTRAHVMETVVPTGRTTLGLAPSQSDNGAILYNWATAKILSRLTAAALYTQKPPVLEDLYRWGICRGTRGVVEARGAPCPYPQAFRYVEQC